MTKLRLNKIHTPAASALLLYLAAFPAHTQDQKGGEEAVRRVDLLSASARLNAQNGTSKEARVMLRQITIPGKQRVDVPLDPGFRVVTLRAGRVAVVLDAKEERHNTGDIWSVGENSKMSVTPVGESAVLEVMSVVVR